MEKKGLLSVNESLDKTRFCRKVRIAWISSSDKIVAVLRIESYILPPLLAQIGRSLLAVGLQPVLLLYRFSPLIQRERSLNK